MDSFEKRTRLVFVLLTGLCVLFQFFQLGGLRISYPFLAPYTNVAFAGVVLLAASFVTALCRRYLPALLCTAAGALLLVGAGFAMTHPAADKNGQTLTGIPAGALWKYFFPALLLLIPAVMLFVYALRRRRREEEARPYEKQF